ncbi:zinc ribbon domain-containing protein [Gordonibacter pamelaeae]
MGRRFGKRACPSCGAIALDDSARTCAACGSRLPPAFPPPFEHASIGSFDGGR